MPAPATRRLPLAAAGSRIGTAITGRIDRKSPWCFDRSSFTISPSLFHRCEPTAMPCPTRHHIIFTCAFHPLHTISDRMSDSADRRPLAAESLHSLTYASGAQCAAHPKPALCLQSLPPLNSVRRHASLVTALKVNLSLNLACEDDADEGKACRRTPVPRANCVVTGAPTASAAAIASTRTRLATTSPYRAQDRALTGHIGR